MELIGIPTAAKRLGLTRQRMYQLIQEGEIQTVDIDGRKFIDWETLDYKVQRHHDKKNEKKLKK
jgi:excisionase family DNA binding protein